jgi:hypothetical protein
MATMLSAEDCRDRADECARLAEATDDPIQSARYRTWKWDGSMSSA